MPEIHLPAFLISSRAPKIAQEQQVDDNRHVQQTLPKASVPDHISGHGTAGITWTTAVSGTARVTQVSIQPLRKCLNGSRLLVAGLASWYLRADGPWSVHSTCCPQPVLLARHGCTSLQCIAPITTQNGKRYRCLPYFCKHEGPEWWRERTGLIVQCEERAHAPLV